MMGEARLFGSRMSLQLEGMLHNGVCGSQGALGELIEGKANARHGWNLQRKISLLVSMLVSIMYNAALAACCRRPTTPSRLTTSSRRRPATRRASATDGRRRGAGRP